VCTTFSRCYWSACEVQCEVQRSLDAVGFAAVLAQLGGRRRRLCKSLLIGTVGRRERARVDGELCAAGTRQPLGEQSVLFGAADTTAARLAVRRQTTRSHAPSRRLLCAHNFRDYNYDSTDVRLPFRLQFDLATIILRYGLPFLGCALRP